MDTIESIGMRNYRRYENKKQLLLIAFLIHPVGKPLFEERCPISVLPSQAAYIHLLLDKGELFNHDTRDEGAPPILGRLVS
jgi:hypothetical protein